VIVANVVSVFVSVAVKVSVGRTRIVVTLVSNWVITEAVVRYEMKVLVLTAVVVKWDMLTCVIVDTAVVVAESVCV
jgi:hypothetical protein